MDAHYLGRKRNVGKQINVFLGISLGSCIIWIWTISLLKIYYYFQIRCLLSSSKWKAREIMISLIQARQLLFKNGIEFHDKENGTYTWRRLNTGTKYWNTSSEFNTNAGFAIPGNLPFTISSQISNLIKTIYQI